MLHITVRKIDNVILQSFSNNQRRFALISSTGISSLFFCWESNTYYRAVFSTHSSVKRHKNTVPIDNINAIQRLDLKSTIDTIFFLSPLLWLQLPGAFTPHVICNIVSTFSISNRYQKGGGFQFDSFFHVSYFITFDWVNRF